MDVWMVAEWKTSSSSMHLRGPDCAKVLYGRRDRSCCRPGCRWAVGDQVASGRRRGKQAPKGGRRRRKGKGKEGRNDRKAAKEGAAQRACEREWTSRGCNSQLGYGREQRAEGKGKGKGDEWARRLTEGGTRNKAGGVSGTWCGGEH